MARQYHCQRCNLSFNRKWNWERHFDNVHSSPSTSYQCPFCPARRKQKSDLRQHLKTVHPDRKSQIQANPGLIQEIRLQESQLQHVVTDAALSTPSPAVAVRSVVRIPDRSKPRGTPMSLCSPGFQLDPALQKLLDENCEDVLHTVTDAATIRPDATSTRATDTAPIRNTVPVEHPIPAVTAGSSSVTLQATSDTPNCTTLKLVLPTDIDPNIPYVPERCAITTQTGISSVEAVPKSPKYLTPRKILRVDTSNVKYKSCGTSMGDSRKEAEKKVEEKKPEMNMNLREDSCRHGIRLPVYERITSTVTEKDSRKRTGTEKMHCVRCWRLEEQEEDDDDSDWGF